ncbi:MAG: glycosyltransferase [Bacteroidetes bacterium]|nr:glycosyltransferase [Bacteroidota bacterium]
MNKRLLNIIKKFNFVIRVLYSFYRGSYISNKRGKWAYISYLPEPFFRQNDKMFLSAHQNRRESVTIGKVFNELNFGFVVDRFDRFFPKVKKYDIVFGMGQNFDLMSQKNPNALKIYYATGAYHEHQNKMIISRTDTFNKDHNTEISYSRLTRIHNSYEIADFIIQIGSKHTLETYPKKLRSKILLIDQSCEDFDDFKLNEVILQKDSKKYIWFGSNGSILKGIDLVVNFFIQNSDFELHIIGKLDLDFEHYYRTKINNFSNIFYHGYMYVHDPEFFKIVSKCSFILFPSGSEGGSPGSVINLMKLGLIPIVSKWAAVDEINELGITIEELNMNGIERAISESQTFSKEKLNELFNKNYNYANSKFNLKKFESQFKEIITYCIDNRNNCENFNL